MKLKAKEKILNDCQKIKVTSEEEEEKNINSF